jgi:hypothetical protein
MGPTPQVASYPLIPSHQTCCPFTISDRGRVALIAIFFYSLISAALLSQCLILMDVFDRSIVLQINYNSISINGFVHAHVSIWVDADDIIVTCIMWYQHVIRRARQIRAAFDRFVLLSVSMLVFNHVVGGVMGGETMAHWETNAYSTAPF